MCVSLEIRIFDDIASLQVSIQLVDTFTYALIIGCEWSINGALEIAEYRSLCASSAVLSKDLYAPN